MVKPESCSMAIDMWVGEMIGEDPSPVIGLMNLPYGTAVD
jgi:hypothetical protein